MRFPICIETKEMHSTILLTPEELHLFNIRLNELKQTDPNWQEKQFEVLDQVREELKTNKDPEIS